MSHIEKPKLTLERVKQLLEYYPDAGVFVYVAKRWRFPGGTIAGKVHNKRGHVYVKIDQQAYLAHRLAWFYVHGEWPSGDLDHINGDRADNRICNLRIANKAPQRGNTSGVKGVSYHHHAKRWYAAITVNRERIRLGSFKTKEEAGQAYATAAAKYHGEFAKTS